MPFAFQNSILACAILCSLPVLWTHCRTSAFAGTSLSGTGSRWGWEWSEGGVQACEWGESGREGWVGLGCVLRGTGGRESSVVILSSRITITSPQCDFSFNNHLMESTTKGDSALSIYFIMNMSHMQLYNFYIYTLYVHKHYTHTSIYTSPRGVCFRNFLFPMVHKTWLAQESINHAVHDFKYKNFSVTLRHGACASLYFLRHLAYLHAHANGLRVPLQNTSTFLV